MNVTTVLFTLGSGHKSAILSLEVPNARLVGVLRLHLLTLSLVMLRRTSQNRILLLVTVSSIRCALLVRG